MSVIYKYTQITYRQLPSSELLLHLVNKVVITFRCVLHREGNKSSIVESFNNLNTIKTDFARLEKTNGVSISNHKYHHHLRPGATFFPTRIMGTVYYVTTIDLRYT